MTLKDGAPRTLGYRMPAEWEPHAATWLSWPHNRESWPGKFETVEPVMVEAVRALGRSETVRINVLDAEHERHVRALLDEARVRGDIRFHPFPTNDAWCRDHGAIFLLRPGTDNPLAAVNWGYNAWGGKYPPWDLDDRIPERMAGALEIPLFDGGMILEGGSIDVNGKGDLLTTESCLLNPNRNPQLTRDQIEDRLRNYLSVDQIIWLGDGIVGDDTDGHIDDITRFAGPRTIVTVVEEDPDEENFGPLAENLERLRQLELAGGARPEIVLLPMPAPVLHEGQRVPASYANFYIANTVVLLPVFGDPNDAKARETLQKLFPRREIVGIDCTDLVWGLGAFHCLTQQVPAPISSPNGHQGGKHGSNAVRI